MKPGDRVARFEILGEAGAGGMGRVFRARDPRLGREVAIKLLAERFSGNEEYVQRFEREACAASALNHPNIVTVYDTGEHDGYPWIAMELIDGKSLRDILRKGFPSMRRLIHVAAQVADGLAAAHEKGITHRDLKPENIMVTPQGLVKILDFGLAKKAAALAGAEQTTADVSVTTEPDRIVGTLNYMSPEQARGGPVDHRSDQFSLGTILYEMLAGRRPFRGESQADVLGAILSQEPEGIARVNPRVPAPLAWLVERCLAKDRDDRYVSTRDIAHELTSIRDHMSEAGSVVTGWSLAMRPPGRRRAVVAASAIGVAVLAGGLWLARRASPGTPLPSAASAGRRVVVLPFRILSERAAGSLIGEGFAETVSALLASGGGVAVLPSGATEGVGGDLASVVQRTGAQLVVRGALQFQEERVRATWAVIEAGGRQLSAGTVDGSTTRLLDLQDDVARRTASSLGLAQAAAAPRGAEPAFAEDRYLQALGHLRRYENEAEVDAAVRILESLGDSAAIQAALARAYLAKRTITGERSWAERAIEASGRAARLEPGLAPVEETRGRIGLLLGRPDEAETAFQKALKAQPLSVEARLGLAMALNRLGRHEDAAREFRRAVEIQPGWWSTHSHLGVFQLTTGNLAAALDSFRTALGLSPDNTRVLDNLGVTLQQLGRHEEAIVEYRRSIEIRPTASALSNLGTCLFVLGRYAEAVKAYERAASMNPGDATLWVNLGDALRWNSEPRERTLRAYRHAIELLEADLALTPRDADRETSLALALARTGDYRRAKAHADAALAIDPGHAYVLYPAALVRLAAGDTGPALDLLARAVAAGYPTGEIVRDPELTPLRSDPRFVKIVGNQPG
ncbi:MAG: tetratricopeptide repeat protein [Holophagales bacterium]|nr:tetratricopeptide repeat protein [Holophagales bacterium]